MYKEGLESFNDLIKIFILHFCDLLSLQPTRLIKLQLPIFLATVLTNKLVIHYSATQ